MFTKDELITLTEALDIANNHVTESLIWCDEDEEDDLQELLNKIDALNKKLTQELRKLWKK